MTDQDQSNRVLVGVDGSEDGLRAVRYGVNRIHRTGGDLWLVNALDDGVVAGGWGVIYDPTVLEQAGRKAISQATETARDLGLAPERIHTDVLVGHPAVILEELSQSAESMILGRRSATGLERMFVGSTSTSLAATAACPLIVISAASNPGSTTGHHQIAVAVGRGRSDKALRWGCEEARGRQAELTVIHVLSPSEVRAGAKTAAGDQPDQFQQALEDYLKPLREDNPDVTIKAQSVVGDRSDRLLDLSARLDLLVLGVRPRPITGIALGGTVRAVMAHALCPVALIK
ncbi:MAG: universal stress protein [Propionibacteriaceae bacterium]|jgi:nucleotide-binding universal stress UspA family protein|nr:universal stress protein [Propionibacteriaceae bacterium]